MEEHFGFIRDKLDIKILLLYILEKLPSPVEPVVLSDLALFDGGFTWFDYTDCLAELVESGLVEQDPKGRYAITEKGRQDVGFVGTSIPYSVRAKADRLTAPVAAAMRRACQIETTSELRRDGSAVVSLRLSDGVDEVLSLRLTAPDEASAAAIERRFQKKAEALCDEILGLLTAEE